MIYSHTGPIRHRQVWIQPNAVGNHDWIQAIWFGLVSYPSRAWGCNVRLECGAPYRNVPLHHLASRPDAAKLWEPDDAQTWDCYGYDFTVVEYPYLAEMGVLTKVHEGSYMFSVIPIGDGWSSIPEQAKEFYFLELDNGRFAALPTNEVLLDDKSFGTPQWPDFLRRQTQIWSAEE